MRLRHLHRLAATLVLATTVVPGIALADLHGPCYMKGTEEVPSNATTGFAIGTIDIINGPTDSARVNVTFQGLSANATAAHIHGPGARGISVGVLIPLTVPPATSGTIAQDVALTPTIKSYMIDGLTYVNIHTGNFPSGEIRGQIDSLQAQTATPAASNSGLVLLGVAIAGLGGAVLFRRRAMA